MATIAQLFAEFKAQLAGLGARLVEELPLAASKANQHQIQTLKDTGAEAKAHKAPDTAPDFTLPNQDNNPVNLQEHLKKGPVILSFYRGRWCPYCNLELRALQKQLDTFKELGATLMAISPQTVEVTQKFATEVPLKYEVLADVGAQVARSYGLVYTLNDDYSNTLASLGVTLAEDNGGAQYQSELPIPATYVVAQSGKIVYAFVDADFTKRASPAELIDILKQIKQGSLG